jgi:CheY-like chemotaxis protein
MVINRSDFAKELITAQNGEDALNYFDDLKLNNLGTEISRYPQLIFLDLNMPVMGGWEFLDCFSKEDYRTQFKDCKVIVLSSTIDPDDINKAKTYPMVLDFLSKPISKEMLEDLKKRLL